LVLQAGAVREARGFGIELDPSIVGRKVRQFDAHFSLKGVDSGMNPLI